MFTTSRVTVSSLSLLNAVRRAHAVTVITGADMSFEAGFHLYSHEHSAFTTANQLREVATSRAFRDDPDKVWGWHEWQRRRMMRAKPNAGHRAIAAMSHYVDSLTVATQNIDDLHERAGCTDVLHLRGSLMHPRCNTCGRPYRLSAESSAAQHSAQRVAAPRCPRCNGLMRPGVVWFGEELPELAWCAAYLAAKASDVLFIIGTSAAEFPAADLPRESARAGAIVVQINTGPTSLDPIAHFNLQGTAAQLLPQLLNRAWDSDYADY